MLPTTIEEEPTSRNIGETKDAGDPKLLVEEAALEQAEAECLEDADARERQRERAAERRRMIEDEYLEKFAEHVRRMYPNAPARSRARDRAARLPDPQ